MQVKDYLTAEKVPFDTLRHEPTYDAQHMAQAVHVRGKDVAKSVLLRAGKNYVLAVLPATHQIDFDAAKRLLKVDRVELASELEFNATFPDCEIGALPPFGSKYGMKTIVDAALARDERIVFEGNTHQESFRIRYADYERLEKPLVGAFASHA